MEFKTKGNKPLPAGKGRRSRHCPKVAFVEAETEAEQGAGGVTTATLEDDKALLPLLYSNRSLAHLDLSVVEEALQDAECTIATNPDFAEAYLRFSAGFRPVSRFLLGYWGKPKKTLVFLTRNRFPPATSFAA
jgi:hypothetical protein